VKMEPSATPVRAAESPRGDQDEKAFRNLW
jgi:hypothetical protein